MTSKKKIAASVGAVGLAAVIALGGTFAWQSISQTALNEAMDTINPGGRLHDDFTYLVAQIARGCPVLSRKAVDDVHHGQGRKEGQGF